MNKQMHTSLTVYYTVLYYIAAACFNANASSSGSFHFVPAKLHKRGIPPRLRLHEHVYTGCNRRNGPDIGRVFLRSHYTDITQNTYIQS